MLLHGSTHWLSGQGRDISCGHALHAAGTPTGSLSAARPVKTLRPSRLRWHSSGSAVTSSIVIHACCNAQSLAHHQAPTAQPPHEANVKFAANFNHDMGCQLDWQPWATRYAMAATSLSPHPHGQPPEATMEKFICHTNHQPQREDKRHELLRQDTGTCD